MFTVTFLTILGRIYVEALLLSIASFTFDEGRYFNYYSSLEALIEFSRKQLPRSFTAVLGTFK